MHPFCTTVIVRQCLKPWLAMVAGTFVALPAYAVAVKAATASSSVQNFDDVAALAQQLATRAFQPVPESAFPKALRELTYDQMRDIRYRSERALWRDQKSPFELMFFHPGGNHPASVDIDVIDQGRTLAVPYRAQDFDFDFGRNKLNADQWGDIGHAGWRAHYAINKPQYKDEVITFLGASYFRAIGQNQRYGLSARGLAIDTVGGASGEEFPRFTHFWIERPAAQGRALIAYALLDSKRATGAYRFEIKPGPTTTVDVRMRIFLREKVARLGIAPLTSMFLSGENQPLAGDYRPEVHDSDGLLVASRPSSSAAPEWLWRPLVRPEAVMVNTFETGRLHGFGLMQRDRRFDSYEDAEARYELRPSAWVEPVGDWGPGHVELVQLPTPDETHDNIVAYWVARQPPAPGQPLDLSYRLHWQGEQASRHPSGWVTQTRMGRGWSSLPSDQLQYLVDFTGPALNRLNDDARVEPVVSAGPGGEIVERNAYRVEATGTWRLAFRVRRTRAGPPVELRAYLQHGQDALTETWTTSTPPY